MGMRANDHLRRRMVCATYEAPEALDNAKDAEAANYNNLENLLTFFPQEDIRTD